MERDEFSKIEVIFPASGKPVVPLAQVGDDERTVITPPRGYAAPQYNAPVYALPEEALSFTVDEASIFGMFRKALQLRGLLRLRDSYTTGNILEDTYRKIEQNHIEFLFALKEDFGALKKWELDLLTEPKCRIPFNDIEYVTFKRWLLKPRLVIKLKPEKRPRFFEVDVVIREVVLHISHKDARLAERLQAAMMMEVSGANLQRLLKG